MNNEIVTSLLAEKNVTGNSTSSYKGLKGIDKVINFFFDHYFSIS